MLRIKNIKPIVLLMALFVCAAITLGGIFVVNAFADGSQNNSSNQNSNPLFSLFSGSGSSQNILTGDVTNDNVSYVWEKDDQDQYTGYCTGTYTFDDPTKAPIIERQLGEETIVSYPSETTDGEKYYTAHFVRTEYFAESVQSDPIAIPKLGEHKDHDGIHFEAWSSTTSLPSSGNYYLTSDVTLSSSLNIYSGYTLNLCLNGHAVVLNAYGCAIYVNNGGRLNLYDCREGQGYYRKYYKNTSVSTYVSHWVRSSTETENYIDGGSIEYNLNSSRSTPLFCVKSGGALYIDGAAICGGLNTSTSTSYCGGAIGEYGTSSAPSYLCIKKAKICGNYSVALGGAMQIAPYVYNCTNTTTSTDPITISNCDFVSNLCGNNSNEAKGGAIQYTVTNNHIASTTFNNCVFESNKARGSTAYGGAVSTPNNGCIGTLRFYNSTINNNQAYASSGRSFGGAVDLNSNSISSDNQLLQALFDGCLLTNNSAYTTSTNTSVEEKGGAINTDLVELTVTNTTMTGNSVYCKSGYSWGGAINVSANSKAKTSLKVGGKNYIRNNTNGRYDYVEDNLCMEQYGETESTKKNATISFLEQIDESSDMGVNFYNWSLRLPQNGKISSGFYSTYPGAAADCSVIRCFTSDKVLEKLDSQGRKWIVGLHKGADDEPIYTWDDLDKELWVLVHTHNITAEQNKYKEDFDWSCLVECSPNEASPDPWEYVCPYEKPLEISIEGENAQYDKLSHPASLKNFDKLKEFSDASTYGNINYYKKTLNEGNDSWQLIEGEPVEYGTYYAEVTLEVYNPTTSTATPVLIKSDEYSITYNSSVTFQANHDTASFSDGSTSKSVIEDVGGYYKFPEEPTNSDSAYAFDGWWTEAEGGEQVTSTTKVKESDTQIYAHWAGACKITTAHTAESKTEGGSPAVSYKAEKLPVNSTYRCDGSRIIFNEDETRTINVAINSGYVFSSWYASQSGHEALPTAGVVTGDMCFYAEVLESVTVTASSTDKGPINESMLLPYTVEKGSKYVLDREKITITNSLGEQYTITIKPVDGYRNIDWQINGASEYYRYKEGTLDADTTFKATPVQTTGARLYRYPGGGGDEEAFYCANQITSPPHDKGYQATVRTPERTGYKFLGYYESEDASAVQIYDKEGNVVSASQTRTYQAKLYAHWEAKQYTITLDKNDKGKTPGPTGPESVTATYDSVLPKLESVPTWDTHTFMGIYDKDFTTQYYDANGESTYVWQEDIEEGKTVTLYYLWDYDIDDNPIAKTGLVYNGSQQALCDAGKKGKIAGTFEYRLSSTEQYSSSLPTAKDAKELDESGSGGYQVQWRFVPSTWSGDPITGTLDNIQIARKTVTVSLYPSSGELNVNVPKEFAYSFDGIVSGDIATATATSQDDTIATTSIDTTERKVTVSPHKNGTVIIDVEATENYKSDKAQYTATITTKYDITKPIAIPFEYDKTKHNLCTAGVEGTIIPGHFEYDVAQTSTENTLSETSNNLWSTTVPQAENPGNYLVTWKYIPDSSVIDPIEEQFTTVGAKRTTSLILNPSKMSITIPIEETFSYTDNVIDGDEPLNVTAISDNTSIASVKEVDKTGRKVTVTPVNAGKANITVTLEGNDKYTSVTAVFLASVFSGTPATSVWAKEGNDGSQFIDAPRTPGPTAEQNPESHINAYIDAESIVINHRLSVGFDWENQVMSYRVSKLSKTWNPRTLSWDVKTEGGQWGADAKGVATIRNRSSLPVSAYATVNSAQGLNIISDTTSASPLSLNSAVTGVEQAGTITFTGAPSSVESVGRIIVPVVLHINQRQAPTHTLKLEQMAGIMFTDVSGNHVSEISNIADGTRAGFKIQMSSSTKAIESVTYKSADGTKCGLVCDESTGVYSTPQMTSDATIIVTLKDIEPTRSVGLDKSHMELDYGSTTAQSLKAHLYPAGSEGSAKVIWNSSDTSVCTVSADANDKTVANVLPATGSSAKQGVATVTAIVIANGNTFTASCEVTVGDDPVPATGINITKPTHGESETPKLSNLTAGTDYSFAVEAEVLPADATNKNIRWEVDDPSVANVYAAGHGSSCSIHALAGGKTTLTATTVDGGFSATVEITVNSTVTYDMNGHGTQVDPTTGVNYDSTLTTPTPAAVTGYSFDGWYKERDCNNKWESTDKVTGDITLYAKWTAKTYQASLDANGGTIPTGGVTDISPVYDSAMPSLAVEQIATRYGYAFTGYYDSSEESGGVKYYDQNGVSAKKWDKDSTSKITLYAHWTAKMSHVIFDPAGGKGSNIQVLEATYDAASPSLAGCILPAKTNMKFEGFFDQPNGGGTKYYDSDGVAVKTKWDKEEPTVVLYAYYTETSEFNLFDSIMQALGF